MCCWECRMLDGELGSLERNILIWRVLSFLEKIKILDEKAENNVLFTCYLLMLCCWFSILSSVVHYLIYLLFQNNKDFC
jgi:hypothetical protein